MGHRREFGGTVKKFLDAKFDSIEYPFLVCIKARENSIFSY